MRRFFESLFLMIALEIVAGLIVVVILLATGAAHFS